MYKIFVSIAFFAIFATAGFNNPPANAMTSEEILKFLGVLGRYSDDIIRTFRPNNQPNISPQPDPNSPSNQPQPTQQDSMPTTDRSLEQFFLPRQ
jgi:hypothetical protein